MPQFTVNIFTRGEYCHKILIIDSEVTIKKIRDDLYNEDQSFEDCDIIQGGTSDTDNIYYLDDRTTLRTDTDLRIVKVPEEPIYPIDRLKSVFKCIKKLTPDILIKSDGRCVRFSEDRTVLLFVKFDESIIETNGRNIGISAEDVINVLNIFSRCSVKMEVPVNYPCEAVQFHMTYDVEPTGTVEDVKSRLHTSDMYICDITRTENTITVGLHYLDLNDYTIQFPAVKFTIIHEVCSKTLQKKIRSHINNGPEGESEDDDRINYPYLVVSNDYMSLKTPGDSIDCADYVTDVPILSSEHEDSSQTTIISQRYALKHLLNLVDLLSASTRAKICFRKDYPMFVKMKNDMFDITFGLSCFATLKDEDEDYYH